MKLPPADTRAVGPAGPAAPPTISHQPGRGSVRPPIVGAVPPPAATQPPSRPAPVKTANVPDGLASVASGTGHSTADAVGNVTGQLGGATSSLSKPIGLSVSAGGLLLEVGLDKTVDGVVGILKKIGGGDGGKTPLSGG